VPYERDPVSTLFDDAARSLLARAYAAPGRWVSTRLAGPEARHVAWASGRGINLLAPDRPSAAGGRGLNARSRWARGFVRAVFYQHKFWSDGTGGWRERKRMTARHSGAVEVSVGRWRIRTGRIPAGREVRVRYHPGARAANQAARAEPPRDRIYDNQGEPGARWSDPQRRDW
jgi:hypothetical protein